MENSDWTFPVAKLSDVIEVPMELSFGCGMCGHRIPDENGGICVPCGHEHSENQWTDEWGGVYSDEEAQRLFETGEAVEVEL